MVSHDAYCVIERSLFELTLELKKKDYYSTVCRRMPKYSAMIFLFCSTVFGASGGRVRLKAAIQELQFAADRLHSAKTVWGKPFGMGLIGDLIESPLKRTVPLNTLAFNLFSKLCIESTIASFNSSIATVNHGGAASAAVYLLRTCFFEYLFTLHSGRGLNI